MFGRKESLTDRFTPLDQMAGAMVGLGGLNWGLVGLTNFDAVRAAFGRGKGSRLVYALVGASAVYAVVRGRQLAKQ